MKLVSFLKDHIPVVVLILCLLVVQAFADLSLPRLTSDIVDVGIQQQGVEDVAVEEMRASTYYAISLMLSPDERQSFQQGYEESDHESYCLTEYGRKNRETLDELMAFPFVIVYYAETNPSMLAGFIGSTGSLDASTGDSATFATLATGLDEAGIQATIAQAKAQLEETGSSLIEQQAINAAIAEYEALGYDMNALQLKSLLSIGARMLAMAVLCMAMSILVGLFAARTGAKIGRSLREQLFSKVLSFSEKEIGGFSAASLITRGTNDIQQIQMMTTLLLRMVLYAPILAIGGIIMVINTNPQLGWIIIAAVVAIFVVIGILFSLTIPKFRIMQSLIDKVNLVSREILTGLPVIRAFSREKVEEARFDAASTELMNTQLFTNRAMSFMMPAMMLIMNLVSVAIVWFGGQAINEGTLQTGDLIAFITYSMVVIMGFLMLGMVAIILPRANVASERVIEVISCESTITDPENPLDAQLPSKAEAPGATICFDHVSFGFDKDAEKVLTDVSFTAEAGKTCALVGSTGSGKSTVMRLIERFHDVDEGAILLDGIDIRRLSQHALRKQIGYVPQKAFLFSGTIAENIAYSDEEMDEARMLEAAEIAQARGFVEELDGGFNAPLSQGGTNVSGGQRQRLAIARALATHARVYLFDDAFSALDYKTDATLRHELETRLTGATRIIVAQRISTVLNADTIVVLEEGRVVAQGTHDTLMETCPEYREIAYSQLSEAELKGGDIREQ